MIPIILCGGSGKRLWPLVNQKVFYKFINNQSLLDISLNRLQKFKPLFIISVEEQKTILNQALKEHKKAHVIYEPSAKNTAVSIALACSLLKEKYKNGIIGIFPADHYIEKESKFQNLLSQGIKTAKQENKIVTFGIPPDYHSSSYGYIKTIKKTGQAKILQATAFIEKPKAQTAKALIKGGGLWNSGIFISPVNLLIHYFEKHLPNLWNEITRIKDKNIHSIYKKIKPVSFDTGIMENIGDYLCIPCDVGWSDLGSWEKIIEWNQKFPGKLNNPVKTFEKNSQGNFVFSTKEKNFGLIGIKNKIIIDGADGLLIADKKQKKKITAFIKEIQTTKKPEWVKKPWGAYRVLMEKGVFKYKELKLNPKSQLSYQSHKKRVEHWIILEGQAKVTIADKIKKLKPNEHVFIDQGIKHRLKNPASKPLLVLEVQMGHCSEEDIIRYKDDYGRV